MKYKTILIALLVSGLFILLSGCFNSQPPQPKEDLPETIGKWRKGGVIAQEIYGKNIGKKYPIFQVDYSVETGKPIGNITNGTQSIIRYTIAIHKNAEEAAKEKAVLRDCRNFEAWKTVALNDRNNKALGTMSICRQLKENNLPGEKNYVYRLMFSNENRVITVIPLIATIQDLIEFTKALPFNSQADLAMIDILSSLENLDRLKLTSLSPPRKITKEPYLKGKTVIVEANGIQTGNYLDDYSRHAEILNEMQSLIQISCEKGVKIGEYEIIQTKERVPAFGSQCKVTVIDYTIPAIIAEKTFSNKELPDYNTFYKSLDPKLIGKEKLEYKAPPLTEQVKNFITSLPIR